jgi:hypothetical protein
MNEEEFRNLAKEKGYGEIEFQKVDPGPEEEIMNIQFYLSS